jgi:anti-sigma factor RsiW
MPATVWRRLNYMRDHRWAHGRLSEYIEGELPPRQQHRLADHENLCPECARLIATLYALLAMLPTLRLPPHAAFGIAERTAENVRTQIEEWN